IDRNGKRNSGRSGDSPAQAALARAGNLYATLMAGFTTIQSVGGPEDADLRDAVERGLIPGPRILTSLTQLSNQRVPPDSLRTLVRSLKTQGADLVKLFASAGLAGCTQIEHGTFATDDELRLMAQHGTIFDPQVCLVFQNYVDHPDAYSFSDSSLGPLKSAIPAATAMFKRAIATPGLKIVFGTDAVALAHGRNADELLC